MMTHLHFAGACGKAAQRQCDSGFIFYLYVFLCFILLKKRRKTSNEQIHKQIKYYNFKQMCVIAFEVWLRHGIPNI